MYCGLPSCTAPGIGEGIAIRSSAHCYLKAPSTPVGPCMCAPTRGAPARNFNFQYNTGSFYSRCQNLFVHLLIRCINIPSAPHPALIWQTEYSNDSLRGQYLYLLQLVTRRWGGDSCSQKLLQIIQRSPAQGIAVHCSRYLLICCNMHITEAKCLWRHPSSTV